MLNVRLGAEIVYARDDCYVTQNLRLEAAGGRATGTHKGGEWGYRGEIMWNEGSRHAPLLIAVLSRPSRKGCLAARSYGRHSCAASHYSGMQHPRCRTPYICNSSHAAVSQRTHHVFFFHRAQWIGWTGI